MNRTTGDGGIAEHNGLKGLQYPAVRVETVNNSHRNSDGTRYRMYEMKVNSMCVCVSLSLSLALSLYLFILPENEKRVENNALEFSFLRMGAIERNAGCLFIAIIGKVFDY